MYNEDSLWRKMKELDNQKRRQSIKETLEKSVKYVHEYVIDVVLVFLLLTLNIFHTFVFIVDLNK